MITNENNIFFFSLGDKYGLHENQITDITKSDFSIYCRFKPNHDLIDKKLKEHGTCEGAIVAKNGQHFGIFFNTFNANGKTNRTVSFTFWQHDEKLGKDVQTNLEFYYDKEDRYYEVMLSHDIEKKEFTLKEGIESQTVTYDNIIDYSDSYTWIGAATLISDDYQSVFYGDIDKLHIQRSVMNEEYATQFFQSYPTFLKNIENDDTLYNVFSSDFKKLTYYKILDMSGNGYHPILFKNEWTNDSNE
jgi:hypothetical protein